MCTLFDRILRISIILAIIRANLLRVVDHLAVQELD